MGRRMSGETGGPKQYLLQRYSTQQQKMEFAESLQHCFTDETREYVDNGPLEPTESPSGCARGAHVLASESLQHRRERNDELSA